MNGRGSCLYCGNPVFGRCARELSSAWEIERMAGGAHAVSGPKVYSGRIAHTVCHESAQRVERAGLKGQESLL
jgi:hypothetical protein